MASPERFRTPSTLKVDHKQAEAPLSREEINVTLMSPEVLFLRENKYSYLQNFFDSKNYDRTSDNHARYSIVQSVEGSESIGFVIQNKNNTYILKFTTQKERAEFEAEKLLLWEKNDVKAPHVISYGQITPNNLPTAGYIMMEAITLNGELAPKVKDILEADKSHTIPLGIISARELVKMHSTPFPDGFFPVETPISIVENPYAQSICNWAGIPYDELRMLIRKHTGNSDISLIHGDFSPLGNKLVSSLNPYEISIIDPFSRIGDPYQDLVVLSWSIGLEQFLQKKLNVENNETMRELKIFTQTVYSEYERLTGKKLDINRFYANAMTFIIKKCHENSIMLNNNQLPNFYKEGLHELLSIYKGELSKMFNSLSSYTSIDRELGSDLMFFSLS